MKRPVLLIVALAFIAGVTGYAVMNNVAKSNSGSASVCEVAECVDLKNGVAVPDTINVPVGSFVQFNSADGKKYNLSLAAEKGSLASDHGSGIASHRHTNGDEHSEDTHAAEEQRFKSGDFSGDEAWRVEFKERGTYMFKDAYDSKINILVVVYEPNGDYRIR